MSKSNKKNKKFNHNKQYVKNNNTNEVKEELEELFEDSSIDMYQASTNKAGKIKEAIDKKDSETQIQQVQKEENKETEESLSFVEEVDEEEEVAILKFNPKIRKRGDVPIDANLKNAKVEETMVSTDKEEEVVVAKSEQVKEETVSECIAINRKREVKSPETKEFKEDVKKTSEKIMNNVPIVNKELNTKTVNVTKDTSDNSKANKIMEEMDCEVNEEEETLKLNIDFDALREKVDEFEGKSTNEEFSEKTAKDYLVDVLEYFKSGSVLTDLKRRSAEYGVDHKEVADTFFKKVLGTIGDVFGMVFDVVGNSILVVVEVLRSVILGVTNGILQVARKLVNIITLNQTAKEATV